MPHALILTAGFGEGHNTAARCLAESLRAAIPGMETNVHEPLREAQPRTTALARKLYLTMIERAPWAWKPVYSFADISDHGQHARGWLAPSARRLRDLIDTTRPDLVASTYPLFNVFWEDYFPPGTPAPCPYFCIVTDSITINRMWTRGRVDHWLVTDPFTAERLADLGPPAERIHVSGFPVSSRFNQPDRTLAAPRDGEPLRLLYFPLGSRRHARAWFQAIGKIPRDRLPVSLTIALGRYESHLAGTVRQARENGWLPEQTEIIGWSNDIPELMAAHHVVLGKAGGATVHEVRAAARPMLVHTIVPGQEEGNAQLLESEGGGLTLPSPDALPDTLMDWAADGFRKWTAAHQSLLKHTRPEGALNAARFILTQTPALQNK